MTNTEVLKYLYLFFCEPNYLETLLASELAHTVDSVLNQH